jgi:GNAT superfamily N-acetyltransferase
MREIFPNVLLLAIQDEEIIGCVGLDCQLFDPARERFGKVKYTKSGAQEEGKEVKVVLGNLAVRRDKRGQGLAKSLVKMCNDYAKSWGYDEIYLLVESENEPAKKLYTKEGYKLLFADEDATCVAPGMYNLQTASCINLCYVKSMTEPKKGLDLGAVFGAIGSLFGRNNDN